jgi:hypothetical protein
MRQYALANGATGGSLADCIRQMLIAQGADDYLSTNDMWSSLLAGQGYTGGLSDKMYQFFAAGGTWAEQTYMTEIANAGAQYFKYPAFSPVSGKLTAEIKFKVSQLPATNMYLWYSSSSSATGGFWLYVGSTGELKFGFRTISGGTSNQSLGVFVNDDEEHLVRIEAEESGSSFTKLYLDGVEVFTDSGTGTTRIKLNDSFGTGYHYIGIDDTLTANNYYSGIPREVKLWDGDGSNDPDRHYPIDETWVNSNVLHDEQTVLGSELVSNGTFGSGDDWSLSGNTINNGTLTIDQPFTFVTQPSVFEAGKRYLVSVDVVTAGTGSCRFPYDGDAANIKTIPNSVGTHVYVFTALRSGGIFAGYITSGSVVLDNISIKQADGYGTAVNISSTDAEQYTLNTSTDPDQWENDDQSSIIPIAY